MRREQFGFQGFKCRQVNLDCLAESDAPDVVMHWPTIHGSTSLHERLAWVRNHQVVTSRGNHCWLGSEASQFGAHRSQPHAEHGRGETSMEHVVPKLEMHKK